MFTLTDEQGKFLVKTARQVIEDKLGLNEYSPPVSDDPVMDVKCGVFVTLNEHTKGNRGLRGCIGMPYPTSPLLEAVIQSAQNAAFQDPRFPPVQPREINGLTIEVSVLTPPEKIEEPDPARIPDHIKVGRDGLIIGREWNKGLLLPQVPVEWKWNSKEFLSQCCVKAGLPQKSWLEPDIEIYRFQAILFKETEPRGIIRRHSLSD